MKTQIDDNESVEKDVYAKFEDFFGQASERLKGYAEADQWLASDPGLIWSGERQAWKPDVFPNLLESIIRQKVALLTDSKPKIYVYTIPEVKLIDDEEHKELIKLHSQNMNMAFDHLWRFNKMQSVLEQIVFYGASYGLMAGRCYWDPKAGRKGEIRTEVLNPRNIFFDESIHRLDLMDGSTELLYIAQLKPKSWFHHYFPGEDITGTEESGFAALGLKGQNVSDYALYIEAYGPASVLGSTDNEKASNKMRVVRMAGTKLLKNEAMSYFPIFIHPYELLLNTPTGGGDVKRLQSLQKDFCSKVSQVSMNIALSANRQYIVNVAKLGVGLDALLEHAGEPGYMFVTKRTLVDIKDALLDLETPKFNPELFQYVFYIPQLMEMVSGLVKLLQGQAAKAARQSKYEVGKQFEAATIRVRNTAHHVEMMLVDMGMIWAKMIESYYKDPRLIYRINEATDEMDHNLFNFPKNDKGKNLKFDYILTVQPDTVLPVDIQSQAERDMQLAQMNAIDPQTLLESLNHPKSDLIVQRLAALREQGGMNQPPRGAAGKGTPAPPSKPALF